MDHIEAVKRVHEEWMRGNYRAGLELYDPAITLEVHSPIPEAGVYERLEGLQRYMRNFLGTWDDYELRALGYEADGDRVIVPIHHSGTISGARAEMEYVSVWTFAGDRVVRFDIAQTRDDVV